MRNAITALALILLFAMPALAQTSAPTHVFDDLNGDGITDARVPPPDTNNSSNPTQETEDEVQPVDPPAEGEPQ